MKKLKSMIVSQDLIEDAWDSWDENDGFQFDSIDNEWSYNGKHKGIVDKIMKTCDVKKHEVEDVNLVSQEFLDEHKITLEEYDEMMEKGGNEGCYNCWKCEDCHYCIDMDECESMWNWCSCRGCKECSACDGLLNCVNCDNCYGSNDLEDCIHCAECFNCKNCEDCFECEDIEDIVGDDENGYGF